MDFFLKIIYILAGKNVQETEGGIPTFPRTERWVHRATILNSLEFQPSDWLSLLSP